MASEQLMNPLKDIYEEIKDTSGWTLEEEIKLEEALPYRGVFPPSDRRIKDYDDFIEKV